jgi:DNA-binding NtrC family response regulator
MEALAEELLGESPAIRAVREQLRKLLEAQRAGRRLPALLLQGETGTGKGMVARLVHRLGPRRGGNPLVVGGKVIGAIGVSGGTGSQDDVIWLAGVAGLK